MYVYVSICIMPCSSYASQSCKVPLAAVPRGRSGRLEHPVQRDELPSGREAFGFLGGFRGIRV